MTKMFWRSWRYGCQRWDDGEEADVAELVVAEAANAASVVEEKEERDRGEWHRSKIRFSVVWCVLSQTWPERRGLTNEAEAAVVDERQGRAGEHGKAKCAFSSSDVFC